MSSVRPYEPFRLAGREALLDRFLLTDRMFFKLRLRRSPRLGVAGGESTSVAGTSSKLVLTIWRGFKSVRLPILRNSRAIRSRADPAGLSVTVSSSSIAADELLSEYFLLWLLRLLLVLGRVKWL